MRIDEIRKIPANYHEDNFLHGVFLGKKLKELKIECAKWLEETNNLPVYRGYHMIAGKLLSKIKVNQNRKPFQSSKEIQIAFDNCIQELGISAQRHNSIFSSGSKNQAEEYGEPRIIYPIGDYTYSWSPVVRDFTYIDEEPYWMDKLGSWSPTGNEINYDFLKEIASTYKTDNLIDAINSGNEILIHCNECYLFNDNDHY